MPDDNVRRAVAASEMTPARTTEKLLIESWNILSGEGGVAPLKLSGLTQIT